MTLGKYKTPSSLKPEKRYIVHQYDVDKKKTEKKVYKNLLKARTHARVMFRQQRFIKLENRNRIPLTL